MPSKSKKQARLMAAVAHNPKFAKKVGIPQSVGQDFYAADRKLRKYAEGGKVDTLKRLVEVLDIDLAPYIQGDSDRPPKRLATRVLKNPSVDDVNRYTGREIKSLRVMTDNDGNTYVWDGKDAIHDWVLRALNMKWSDISRASEDEPIKARDYERWLQGPPKSGYAEGGKALPSSKDEEEPWTDTYLKRPLSGLAAMWGSADPETGEFVNPAWHNIKRVLRADSRRKAGLPREEMAIPGIVDETVAIPALGGIFGLPVPEFAEEAEERASATREASRGALDLDAPRGFTENITESAGVMAGQMPVPASIAGKLKVLKNSGKLGKAGKVLGPAVEWFSPTVVPKAGNYLKGTLFGGVLGGGLDYLEDYINEQEQEKRNKQFISEAIAEILAEETAEGTDDDIDDALAELGYAEGGKVLAARRALTSLRENLDAPEENKELRQAKIDEALRKITVPGTVALPKTIRAALNEQRTDPGIRAMVDRALPLLAPARQLENFNPADIVSNLPPVASVKAVEDTARGFMPDSVFERRLRSLGYHDKGANPKLAREMELLDQEDKDWDKLFGYAEGGRVGETGSQSWYETYGQGPEHLFLGERTIPSLEGWTPSRPNTPQIPPVSGGGSSTVQDLIGLASLGLIGWDAYRDLTAGAGDAISGVDWNNLDLDFDEVDTQGTLDWLNQDLSDLEMPTAEFDPTALERVGQGAAGAFDVAMGAMQGGVGGAGSLLQGSNDIYQALAGDDSALMERIGTVGSILSNIGDGTVEGYVNAGGDIAELAQAMGYSGPVLDSAGKFLPIVGDLFNAYEGIQQGGVRGYVNAVGSLMQAYSAAQAAGVLGGAGAAGAAGAGAAGAAGAAGTAAAGSAAAGAGAAGTAGAAGAGTAGATTGAAGTAGAGSGVLSSLGPALALWAAAASAIDWAGKKYGDTKVGDIYGTDWMSGPVNETRYYVRNPYEGDIGSFNIYSEDIGAGPTAALREQWRQQGIDDSGIDDFSARTLSHLQNMGDTTGYGQYMDWLTGADPKKEELENFDWDSYFGDGLVVPVI